MIGRPTVPGFTVDFRGTRDRDDAFWVERLSGGRFALTVSIADVASHVLRGSPDDEGAASRGLSIYGEGVRACMFGEHVTTRLASLDPAVPRAVISARIVYSQAGDVISEHHQRSVLRSLAALNYGQFDDILATPTARLRIACMDAQDLAQLLWQKRVQSSGVPDWDSAFDMSGGIKQAIEPGLIGQSVVHEFMVAVNTASSRFLKDLGRPMIYRNQGPRSGGPGGRYEIVCHGHRALGVSAYGNFTNPLRSYVNLVNQRAVAAAIEGLPPPYTVAEHSKICSDANITAQRAEALARAKAALPDEGESPAAPTAIDKLDPFAFRCLLKNRGGFDIQTLADFQRRMNLGLLTHADAAWTLFSKASAADDSQRSELLKRLLASPGEIERILRLAREDYRLPAFEAESMQTTDGWASAASIGRYVGEAHGNDPVQTREMAIIRLTAAILRLPELPHPRPGDPTIRFTDTRSKKRLEDLCAMMGWGDPVLTTESQESGAKISNARTQVVVSTDDYVYRSPVAHGSHAAATTMAAAETAYSALLPYAEDLLRREMKANGINVGALAASEDRDGPQAALEEFCMRYGAKARVIWTRERPSVREFSCTLEISGGGRVLQSFGWGSRAKDAQAAASTNAIATLLGKAPAADLEACTEEEAAPAI
jgi:hypothetical protein